jgi:hypothetical protein
MKKLLDILVDIMLFSFLLIILAMPFLVSFNLDPVLYKAKSSKVAGVSSSTFTTFTLNESFSTSQKFFVKESSNDNNTYTLTLTLSAGNKFNDSFSIGDILNQTDSSQTLQAKIYGKKQELKGINISLTIGETNATLFNGIDSSQKEFVLQPQTKQTVNLQVQSNQSFAYPIEVKLEIKT